MKEAKVEIYFKEEKPKARVQRGCIFVQVHKQGFCYLETGAPYIPYRLERKEAVGEQGESQAGRELSFKLCSWWSDSFLLSRPVTVTTEAS